MAYPRAHEVVVAVTQSLATAADIGLWAPGSTPHILRKAALVFTVAAQATGATAVDRRPTAGSDTGRVEVAEINYTTTTGAQGKVVQKSGLNQEFLPGEELVFEVTDDTPSSGTAHLVILVEPRQEQAGNITDLQETT